MPTSQSTPLILDDDRLFNEVLYEDLRTAGNAVLQAFSSAEGLKMVKGKRVDAILLDQNLPEGDGCGWHRHCCVVVQRSDL